MSECGNKNKVQFSDLNISSYITFITLIASVLEQHTTPSDPTHSTVNLSYQRETWTMRFSTTQNTICSLCEPHTVTWTMIQYLSLCLCTTLGCNLIGNEMWLKSRPAASIKLFSQTAFQSISIFRELKSTWRLVFISFSECVWRWGLHAAAKFSCEWGGCGTRTC